MPWQPPNELSVTESSLSSHETNLPCDAHDLEIRKADYVSQTYQRLSKDQRQKFTKKLSRKSQFDFESVNEYISKWKSPDNYYAKTAQSYERLVKETLNIPTNVRNGGCKADFPSEEEKKVLGELYVATQCFLAIHFGTRDEPAYKKVYRGIRKESIAKLTAQVIDNPESDEYHFHTSTVSNHTGLEGVAFHHSESIVISLRVPRKQVVFAPDRLFNTPSHEDEFQLAGGTIQVRARNVVHEGTESDETRRLTTLIQSMESPQDLSDDDLKDIADLVQIMSDEQEPLHTSDGAERLEEWWHELSAREIYHGDKKRYLKAAVDYLKEPTQ